MCVQKAAVTLVSRPFERRQTSRKSNDLIRRVEIQMKREKNTFGTTDEEKNTTKGAVVHEINEKKKKNNNNNIESVFVMKNRN